MGNKESKTENTDKLRMAEFDDWLNKRLTKYFEDIETVVLDVKVSHETQKDIKEAVEEMVASIFKEVEKIDERLQVKKAGLMKIGNFFENTDIICLDEIDIFAILENLSSEEIIEVKNTTMEYFETVQIQVKEKYAEKWEDCMAGESTKSGLLSGEKIVTRLYDVIESAVGNIRSNSKDVLYKKHGYLELIDDPGVSKRGCSICLKFGWTGAHFFSVIITPVLKVNKTESYILYKEVLNEMVYEAINACGSLLLVPEMETENEKYFRLSLAHTECYLMNKEVSVNHKRVYRILQFLVNGYNKKETCDYQLFKLEQLKTLLITHDMTCGKKDTVGQCVMAVIDKMEEFLKDVHENDGKIFLPSIFIEPMNVFRRTAVSTSKEIVELNLSAVSKLKEHLINDVGRSPSYVFRDISSKLVPVNQYLLNADYHARKSRVDLVEDIGTETP